MAGKGRNAQIFETEVFKCCAADNAVNIVVRLISFFSLHEFTPREVR